MVRLEDYSLIKTLNVPDEIKGIIKRCVSEKAFSELSIREDVRAQIMGSSNSYNIVGGGGGGGGGTGINPNIFSTNTNSYMNQQNPQSCKYFFQINKIFKYFKINNFILNIANNLYPSNTNTNNPLSFLNNTNTNTNNNQATSFFQKPTLSNNNNIFGQPNTGQNVFR